MTSICSQRTDVPARVGYTCGGRGRGCGGRGGAVVEGEGLSLPKVILYTRNLNERIISLSALNPRNLNERIISLSALNPITFKDMSQVIDEVILLKQVHYT